MTLKSPLKRLLNGTKIIVSWNDFHVIRKPPKRLQNGLESIWASIHPISRTKYICFSFVGIWQDRTGRFEMFILYICNGPDINLRSINVIDMQLIYNTRIGGKTKGCLVNWYKNNFVRMLFFFEKQVDRRLAIENIASGFHTVQQKYHRIKNYKHFNLSALRGSYRASSAVTEIFLWCYGQTLTTLSHYNFDCIIDIDILRVSKLLMPFHRSHWHLLNDTKIVEITNILMLIMQSNLLRSVVIVRP